MALLDQDVTDAPTVLAGTEDDTFYSIQNVGDVRVNFRVSADAPDAGDRSFYLNPGQTAESKHPSGSGIYAWAPHSRSAVVYEESG